MNNDENGGESNDSYEGSNNGNNPMTERATNISAVGPSAPESMGTTTGHAAVYCATSEANSSRHMG